MIASRSESWPLSGTVSSWACSPRRWRAGRGLPTPRPTAGAASGGPVSSTRPCGARTTDDPFENLASGITSLVVTVSSTNPGAIGAMTCVFSGRVSETCLDSCPTYDKHERRRETIPDDRPVPDFGYIRTNPIYSNLPVVIEEPIEFQQIIRLTTDNDRGTRLTGRPCGLPRSPEIGHRRVRADRSHPEVASLGAFRGRSRSGRGGRSIKGVEY